MTQIDTTCSDCGRPFYITDKEQEFYKSKNFEMPKRCFNCRRKRKAEREGQR